MSIDAHGDVPGSQGSHGLVSDGGIDEPAIHALDGALTKAGLPGELLRVLDRVEALVAAGRVERDKAQAKLEAATRGLLADVGEIDAAGYGRVLAEVAPWISADAVASVGLGDAARQVRMRAVMVTFGLSSGIYRKLTDHCRDVVAVIGGVRIRRRSVADADGRRGVFGDDPAQP